jgi:hypothetical protein
MASKDLRKDRGDILAHKGCSGPCRRVFEKKENCYRSVGETQSPLGKKVVKRELI